jgi:hypothetical protein
MPISEPRHTDDYDDDDYKKYQKMKWTERFHAMCLDAVFDPPGFLPSYLILLRHRIN